MICFASGSANPDYGSHRGIRDSGFYHDNWRNKSEKPIQSPPRQLLGKYVTNIGKHFSNTASVMAVCLSHRPSVCLLLCVCVVWRLVYLCICISIYAAFKIDGFFLLPFISPHTLTVSLTLSRSLSLTLSLSLSLSLSLVHTYKLFWAWILLKVHTGTFC